ncbi:MAG: type II toxin-antitoxin system HicB family antitoxin [bacterium]|nr:type II toxin-antitoxin system HicB family antitoxin [bacterium]
MYNGFMSSIIQFTIKKDEDGVYCAKAVDHPIFTFGKTLPELENNIREVTALYIEDEDLASLGISAEPSLLVNFEIPRVAYA